MTRDKLKQYLAYQKEIKKLDESIEKLRRQAERIPVVSGKVQASQKDFPYIEEHVTVQMKEPRLNDTIERRLLIREKRLEEAQRAVVEIEQYIASIDDSTDRQIFEQIYLEGKTQEQVGEALGYTQVAVAKRIKKRLDRKE